MAILKYVRERKNGTRRLGARKGADEWARKKGETARPFLYDHSSHWTSSATCAGRAVHTQLYTSSLYLVPIGSVVQFCLVI